MIISIKVILGRVMQNKSLGNITNLFISKKDIKNRIEKDELTVDSNGVVEDKYYAKSDDRAILITSLESYELALKNGIEVALSSLGENILIDINPYHLVSSDRIKIGETVLEITQNCTICSSLAKIDSELPRLLKNDRGIFAKVIDAGVIRVGDKVEFLEKVTR